MNAEGPLPNWLAPVARVAAVAYGAAVHVRARRLEQASAATSLEIPVVSVGNITAGGTGKTPFVRWCVRHLQAAGRKPIVALRGYRSHQGRSDEAMEYAELLPGVELAVGPNRVQTIARTHAAHPATDCAVLDDGFQHRRVARALDIVLIDATRPGLAGALLPAGWLREPAHALRRADAVVVTRAGAVMPELNALIERHYGKPADAWCRHAWGAIDVFECAPGKAPVRRTESAAFLQGKKVVAVAGLGNPQPFMQMLHDAGATISAQHIRADHAAYRAADALRLLHAAQEQQAVLATTWKDWTKLSRAILENVREPAALASSYMSASTLTVVVPRVEIEFVTGEPEIRAALTRATAPAHG